jgi:hypothetical protein
MLAIVPEIVDVEVADGWSRVTEGQGDASGSWRRARGASTRDSRLFGEGSNGRDLQ